VSESKIGPAGSRKRTSKTTVSVSESIVKYSQLFFNDSIILQIRNHTKGLRDYLPGLSVNAVASWARNTAGHRGLGLFYLFCDIHDPG
jgi:hypothetical protein